MHTTDMIKITPMGESDAQCVAKLHADSINEGFLAKLGIRFLQQLYLGIAEDGESKVWVAKSNDKVMGFCAYSYNVNGMYRRVLRRRLIRLALAALPRAMNPLVIKEALDTLRYPAKQNAQKLTATEILSIAVDECARGTGVGKMLLNRAMEQAMQDGASEIKVLAGADLEGANRFYTSYGFTKSTRIIQHGEALNVYVKPIVHDT